MLKEKVRVLLTAVGCPGGPSIISSLRKDPCVFIIGTDMKEEVPGKYLVDNFYRVPPGRNDNYINAILEIVNKEKIDVILPLATFELEKLASHVELFKENNCKICVSQIQNLRIANNRFLLYEYFKNQEYIPRYDIPHNWEDMENKMKKLGFPDKKVVIKPFVSHGSRGLRIINNHINLYNEYLTNKPSSLEIPISSLKEIFKNNEKIKNILLCEYLSGKEFGVDLLLDPRTKKVICGVVRDNGDVFLSEVSCGIIVHNHRLLRVATKIAETLQLEYTVNLDFRCNQDGIPKLLEINPRIPATSFLATTAGLNFPLYSVYLALGKEFSISEVKYGLRIYSYRGFMVIDKNDNVIKWN